MTNLPIRSTFDVANACAAGLGVPGADASTRRDHPPPALVSIVRLLRDAGQALSRNRDEARRCIDKAAALLQGELSPGQRGAGTATAARRAPLTPWQVARVTAFVDANLSEKIKLESLAALTGLSLSYFSRSFHATVGAPPCAYVVRRRIERAQDLIRLTHNPLAEIALDCGFADQAHLCKHFRRIVGVSPRGWRRLHAPAPEIVAS
jgi:AraC family transcriptional regulator